jgi:hypothetical protein
VNPNKAQWEKADFTRIAESMRESGEALVKKLGIPKGLKVLDHERLQRGSDLFDKVEQTLRFALMRLFYRRAAMHRDRSAPEPDPRGSSVGCVRLGPPG